MSRPVHADDTMPVMAIVNQKGGCGKTMTAVNLAASLAERGYGTLLIDMDPQAHSTMGLGFNPEELGKSLFDVLCHKPANGILMEEILLRISPWLHLAPSHSSLRTFQEIWCGVQRGEEVLYETLEPLCRRYDFILIDCPAEMGLLTLNALRAADRVLIPVEP